MMRPGERELGLGAVVERRAVPVRRVVAVLAGHREPGRVVGRVRGPVVVGLVAGRALRAQPLVHPAAVAALALLGDVRPGQRELGLAVVIENRPVPGRRVVAVLTGHREPGRAVNRLGRPVVVGLVAGRALRAQPLVHPTPVAALALLGDVRAGEGELGLGAVVERRPVPVRRVVARLAGHREPSRIVGRVGRPVVVGLVAGRALRAQPLVHPAAVAALALLGDVRPGQRELGLGIVIEVRPVPVRRVVAVWQVTGNPAGS